MSIYKSISSTIRVIPVDDWGPLITGFFSMIRTLLIQRYQLETKHCKIFTSNCASRSSQAPSEETGTWVWDGDSVSMMMKLIINLHFVHFFLKLTCNILLIPLLLLLKQTLQIWADILIFIFHNYFTFRGVIIESHNILNVFI